MSQNSRRPIANHFAVCPKSNNHRPPKIQTKLHIWWALDKLGLNITHTNWEEYTTGSSYTKVLEGNHFSIVNPPYVQRLAQDLQACLEVVRSFGTS